MIKIALLLLCEVYGISDSPQRYDCSFNREKLHLTCNEGIYQLNDEVVEMAYHYEVEEGPVPLVFRTSQSELTVVAGPAGKHAANLIRKGKSQSGTCRD